jgi:hypothetical protein
MHPPQRDRVRHPHHGMLDVRVHAFPIRRYPDLATASQWKCFRQGPEVRIERDILGDRRRMGRHDATYTA